MISSDSCSKLVAGNYDILVSEPSPLSTQALKDFLARFQKHQSELELALEGAGKAGTTFSYAQEFKLLKEFSTSLKQDKANLIEGQSEFNSKKNRYKDIIPFSHTRVILSSNGHIKQDPPQQQPHLPGLDYINANYVRGPSGSTRAYIAAQGPLPSTVCDFWRMVWECGVSVIVMACNEYESGELKCAPYYPNQIGHSIIYGNLKVTLSRVRQICPDFLIRKLTVSLLSEPRTNSSNGHPVSRDELYNKYDIPPQVGPRRVEHTEQNNNNNNNNSNNNQSTYNPLNFNLPCRDEPIHRSMNRPEASTRNVILERTICQFHYTTWPDHGVPNSVEPILELVRLMRDVQPCENKPILVHCSAGCGRTGTICCIDYVWGLLRRNKLNSNFNLWSIIREMRQQRMAMVQTLEQYILCHKAVATLFINHLNLIDSSLYNESNTEKIEEDGSIRNECENKHDEDVDEEDDDDEEGDDDDEDDDNNDEEQDKSKSFNEQLMGPVLI